MSKRNKKKLKKLHRIAAQNRQSQEVETAEQISGDVKTTEISETEIVKSKSKLHDSPISEEESRHVKKEIRKILLTVLGLIVIIIAIALINTKTDMILKFGTFAANKLNIQI